MRIDFKYLLVHVLDNHSCMHAQSHFSRSAGTTPNVNINSALSRFGQAQAHPGDLVHIFRVVQKFLMSPSALWDEPAHSSEYDTLSL